MNNAMWYPKNSRSTYKKVPGTTRTLHIAVKKVKQFFWGSKKYKYKEMKWYLVPQGAIQ